MGIQPSLATAEELIKQRKSRISELRKKATETINVIDKVEHELTVNGCAPEILEHCHIAKEELNRLKKKISETKKYEQK